MASYYDMIPARSTFSNETFMSSISQIILKRNNGGFGFNVVGGRDSEHLPGISDPFVAFVEPNSVADQGGIHEGDRILAINGVDVRNRAHDDIVDLLRKSSTLRLTMEPNGEERLLTESQQLTEPRMLPRLEQHDRTAAYVADLKTSRMRLFERIENDKEKAGSWRRNYVVLFGMGMIVGAVVATVSFKQGRLSFSGH